jgi:hypothetical protein
VSIPFQHTYPFSKNPAIAVLSAVAGFFVLSSFHTDLEIVTAYAPEIIPQKFPFPSTPS